MLGLYVYLGDQRTKRFTFPKDAIRIGSGPDNDLVLNDGGDIDAEHCSLRVENGTWYLAAGTAPVSAATGRPVTAMAYPDGARIEIGDYTVVLALADHRVAIAIDPVEERLLRSIEARDDASRLVYADWLEEHGFGRRAEFVRVQQSLIGASLDTAEARDAFAASSARLSAMAKLLDPKWRRRVARPVLENCQVRFELPCPKEWGSLGATDRPNVRSCDTCKQHVHYCETVGEARDHAARGECVAIDVVVPRYEGDLERRPVRMAGMMAPMRLRDDD